MAKPKNFKVSISNVQVWFWSWLFWQSLRLGGCGFDDSTAI